MNPKIKENGDCVNLEKYLFALNRSIFIHTHGSGININIKALLLLLFLMKDCDN